MQLTQPPLNTQTAEISRQKKKKAERQVKELYYLLNYFISFIRY